MNKNNLNSYKLKITTLSPVHIGTGEVYEPTNFVIDGGYLYEFDEVLFLQNLPQQKRNQFVELAKLQTNNGNELFEKIHAFIVQNKQAAIEVAINRIKVSKSLETKYKHSIAKKVQVEGGNKNNKYNTKSVFNKFEIQKTQRQPNNVSTYLPASSIKGAISTAYQEAIFKKNGKKELHKLFDEDKVFRNLVISDTLFQQSNSEIAYAVNKELFEDDSSEISTMIEVNSKGSEYLLTLNIKSFLNDDKEKIKETITKKKIIDYCNAHYNILYDNKEKQKIKLKENQFLLSVGKHSGARATTIDGLRKILVKLCQIQNKRDEGDDSNARVERLYKKSHFEADEIMSLFSDEKLLDDKEKKDWQNAKYFVENPSRLESFVKERKRVTINAILTQETTVWKFSEDKNNNDGDSFGWLLCEFIEDSEYEKLSKEFKKNENNLIESVRAKREEIYNSLKNAKALAKEKALQKQKDKEESLKKETVDKAKKEAKLASMSPLEREIESLIELNPNKSETVDIVIFNAIKNGKLDEFKCEALKKLQEEMKNLKKWVEHSKKPEKDKKYKRTIEVITMLKDCN